MSPDVRRAAALAQLTLTAEEQVFLPQELAALQAALDRLVPEANAPALHVAPAVLRPDAPRPSLPQAVALQNAAQAKDGYFFLKK